MRKYKRRKTKERRRNGPDPELVRRVQRQLVLVALLIIGAIVLVLMVFPRMSFGGFWWSSPDSGYRSPVAIPWEAHPANRPWRPPIRSVPRRGR